MAEQSLFEKIADGTIPSWKVWEDDTYMAFLTPFPNTPGFTVVVPKKNPGDNFITVDDSVLSGLMLASKKVATLLQNAFGVQRVGLVIEGEGVPHLHVKLIPMHGQSDDSGPHAQHTEFFDAYPGYLTTIEGPRMTDEQLNKIQAKIKAAA
ncbi:MAG TPA: HIT family protein [Candidatus Saccharimonadales bacterium]|nr:HIT family protein [Candidatus Saccharimonadales bacterium]